MTLNSHQLEAEHLNIILLIVCICFIVCVFILFLFCFVTDIVMPGCFYEYAVVVLTECKLTGVVVEPPAASPCSWKFIYPHFFISSLFFAIMFTIFENTDTYATFRLLALLLGHVPVHICTYGLWPRCPLYYI